MSVIALSEAAAKYNVANMQVTTGQTLTNSVQNVAEGKSDVAAAPFVLPFLLSRAVGPYAKVGKEKGAELANSAPFSLPTFAYGPTARERRNGKTKGAAATSLLPSATFCTEFVRV